MGKLKMTIIYILALFVFLFPMGCSKKEETPPQKEENMVEKDNSQQEASYVGPEKCYSCHEGVKDALAQNSHGTAFKSLESYNINIDKEIFLYEDVSEGEGKSYKLEEAEIVGVMADHYVVGSFGGDYYRIAAIEGEKDSWQLKPVASKDVDDDGKEEWLFKSYTCGKCHSPGLEVDPEMKTDMMAGISCETCHGPGSVHVTTKSKEAISRGEEACLKCHTDSKPQVEGEELIAQNHYGTRSWFDGNHNKGSSDDCLNCHTAHKVNALGQMIKEDSPQELCNTCHSDKDPEKIMWINPTDPHNHFTKDHSFGKYPYEKYDDDPATKPVEIRNPETIEKMQEKLENK